MNGTSQCGLRRNFNTRRAQKKSWQKREKERVHPVDRTDEFAKHIFNEHKEDGKLGDEKRVGVEEHQVAYGVLGREC